MPTSTDQRVKLQLGELVVANADLARLIEELQAENAELKARQMKTDETETISFYCGEEGKRPPNP